MLGTTKTLAALTVATLAASATAAITITEVHSTGSSNTSYGADWFELTNTGASAVDVTGWKFDDSSPTFASAVAFRGITSIPAGASVVFLEANSGGTNDATKQADFRTAWFGASAPAGLITATYGGSGIGLSSGGDAVNIFDAAGNLVVGVNFGAPTAGVTYDNTAGASGTISTPSAVGVNNAFASLADYNNVDAPGVKEIGSPGNLVPEPTGLALLGLAGLGIARRRRA